MTTNLLIATTAHVSQFNSFGDAERDIAKKHSQWTPMQVYAEACRLYPELRARLRLPGVHAKRYGE